MSKKRKGAKIRIYSKKECILSIRNTSKKDGISDDQVIKMLLNGDWKPEDAPLITKEFAAYRKHALDKFAIAIIKGIGKFLAE